MSPRSFYRCSLTVLTLLLLQPMNLYGFTSLNSNSNSHFQSAENVKRAVQNSYKTYEYRRSALIKELLENHRNAVPSNNREDNRDSYSAFAVFAISAFLSEDLEGIQEVNRILEEEDLRSWNYGSSFNLPVLGSVCYRTGDYDFVSFFIAAIGILSDKSAFPLTIKAREKILTLLPEYGPPPKMHTTLFQLEGAVCKRFGKIFPDTENHVLMTEISRYLSNQLRGIDNESNGFNLWLGEHLQLFLHNFFNEYNSKPYQQFALQPIYVLANLAENADVRDQALKVIETTSAIKAIQGNRFRRFSPFRRQPGYQDSTVARDGTSSYSAPVFLTGAKAEFINNSSSLLAAAVLFEENPLSEATTSLYLFQNQLEYVQEITYKGNREIYYRKPPFLLSSGGQFHFYENCAETQLPFITKCGSDDEHGWPTATVLIPTAEESENYRDMVHFAGHNNIRKRRNFCVDSDFACGLNIKIPEQYAKCTQISEGNWTFYNLDDYKCPLGFKLAAYEHECRESCWETANNYGVLSVNSDSTIDFAQFKNLILSQNPQEFVYDQEQTFTNIDGHSITFLISESGSKVFKKQSDAWLNGNVLKYRDEEIEIRSPILNRQENIEIQGFEKCEKGWTHIGLNCYFESTKLIASYKSEEAMQQTADKICKRQGLEFHHWQHFLLLNPTKKELKVYCSAPS